MDNRIKDLNSFKEIFLWYKRKLAMAEDIDIEDITEDDYKDVQMLTENNNE